MSTRSVTRQLPPSMRHRPLDELRSADPEAAHWVVRIQSATDSDLIVAACRELSVLERTRSAVRTLYAAATAACVAAVSVCLGWAGWVLYPHLMESGKPSRTGSLTLHQLSPVLAGPFLVGWIACSALLVFGTYRTVQRRGAHRLILARDRLARWLPPTDPPHAAVGDLMSTTAEESL